MESAIIFMYSFFLKLENEIESYEIQNYLQLKGNEIYSLTKSILSKFYTDFDVHSLLIH